MTSQLSVSNNCNRPLTGDPSGNTFTGAFESSAGALVIAVFVASPTTGLVTINQSNNRGVNIQLTDTFNINAEHTDAMNVFRVPCGFSSFQVIFQNNEGTQTYLSLNTYLESFYNSEVNATVTGSVDATITSPLDANGDVKVKATNLITETLATRRVDFLVAGDWYRVASVGLTSGAEWQVISGGTACVGGQSVPDIGRLFKCVVAGPAVAGGGECYDVEYTTDVSATVTNLITETLATRRVDFLVVGDWYRVAIVGLTSGAQWNAIGAIVDGESVPAIGRLFKCLSIGPAVAGGGECYDVEYTDDVSATITNFPATQAVSGTVSLTSPTTVRVSDYYGDPILTTAGNLMVGINNIYTANPLHTIVDSGPATQAVTGTFYQATQPVSIASSVAVTGTFFQATQPVSLPSTSVSNNLSATNSGVSIKNSSGQLISLFMNSNGVTGTNYVKIYNLSSPTSTDTPVLIIPIDYGRSQNVDCVNLSFNTAIGLRVTANAANNDNNAPTNTINVSAFYI